MLLAFDAINIEFILNTFNELVRCLFQKDSYYNMKTFHIYFVYYVKDREKQITFWLVYTVHQIAT